MMDIKDLDKRHTAIKAERSTIESVWDEVVDYILPHRGKMFEKASSENAVEWDDYRLFDTTAVDASHTLSASIQGSLVSPSTQWFYLNFKEDDFNDNKDSASWLEECEKNMYSALQESNFNQEVAETLSEVSGFHTAVLTHEYDEKLGEMIFKAVPIKESYFELDHHDKVIFFNRLMEWNVSKIVAKFGRDALPESIRTKVDNPSMQADKIEICFSVWKREDKVNADISGMLVPDERPYGYTYWVKGTCEPIGEEGGYYECPVYVTRWLKSTDSVYGHGPSNFALPTIRMLNETVMMDTRAFEKALDPATYGTELGVIGDLDLGAGGHTIVRDIDGLRVLESRARFDVSESKIIRMQAAIRKVFRVDELEMKESPAMTATEVRVRYELMQRLLGPTFGRFQVDLLGPIVTNSFSMMYRNDRLPEAPASVVEAQADMNIDYIGPLARAQRNDQVMTSIEWVQTIVALKPYQDNITDNINFDKFASMTGTMRGVPTDLIPSESDIKKTRKNRAAVQAQQLQIQMAQAEGDANKAQAEGEKAVKEVDGE